MRRQHWTRFKARRVLASASAAQNFLSLMSHDVKVSQFDGARATALKWCRALSPTSCKPTRARKEEAKRHKLTPLNPLRQACDEPEYCVHNIRPRTVLINLFLSSDEA